MFQSYIPDARQVYDFACIQLVLPLISLRYLHFAFIGGSADSAGYAGEFWPDNIDGTDCFPEYHRLMADQEKARVVDVMIPAGTAETPHTHKIDSFMFVDQPTQVTVRNVDHRGNEKIVHQSAGSSLKEVSLPIWQYMEPEPYHYVENRD